MRKFIITVNGNEYEVDVEEVAGQGQAPRPVREEASASPARKPVAKKVEAKKEVAKEVSIGEGEEAVEAPMPGTILSVKVKEGDRVEEGDILMILEAMKMENEILAPKSGTVKAIGTSEGSSVDTGDKLVVLE